MITSANIPMGSVGSLFQNPAQAALDDFNTVNTGLNNMMSTLSSAVPTSFTMPTFPNINPATGSIIPDPTTGLPPVVPVVLSYTDYVNAQASNITAGISSKISALSTEVPLINLAAAQQNIVASTDAVLSGNISAIPDQVAAAFPTLAQNPGSLVQQAFGPITQAQPTVSNAVSNIASQFDNVGHMTSVFSAVNSIPGVAVSTGKDMLSLLGTATGTLQSSVNSAISGVID